MKGYYSIKLNKGRVRFFLYDTVMLLFSIAAAYFIRYAVQGTDISKIPLEKTLIYFAALFPQMAVLFYITGIYERYGIASFTKLAIKGLVSIAVLGMINGLIFYIYQTLYIGRLIFFLQLVIFAFMVCLGRYLALTRINKKKSQFYLFLVNLTPEEKEYYLEELHQNKDFQFLEFDFERRDQLEAFLKILDEHAMVAISSQCPHINNNLDLFITLKFNKFHVYDIETFYTNVTGKIPYNSPSKVWNLISEREFFMGISSYYNLKRLIDLVLSAFLLILLSPLFLVLSPLIKFTSKGPVFFVQERLGWNKKPFKLIKFRTMKDNAEKDTGPKWSSDKDSRITPIGKFLRKTRLDELPQLINVLKGEMSFVGNRPIRQHFADILTEKIPHYDLRFMIKPGLTGWSQVKHDYAGSVEGQMEKFKYELFYIKHMSFVFDMIILLKTVKTVTSMNGN